MLPTVEDLVDRLLRQSTPDYIFEANLWNLLTAPVIYLLLLPLLTLDAWVTVYQRVCFPIYGITRVPRRRYFAIVGTSSPA